jgi:hypothetical protein
MVMPIGFHATNVTQWHKLTVSSDYRAETRLKLRWTPINQISSKLSPRWANFEASPNKMRL